MGFTVFCTLSVPCANNANNVTPFCGIGQDISYRVERPCCDGNASSESTAYHSLHMPNPHTRKGRDIENNRSQLSGFTPTIPTHRSSSTHGELWSWAWDDVGSPGQKPTSVNADGPKNIPMVPHKEPNELEMSWNRGSGSHPCVHCSTGCACLI